MQPITMKDLIIHTVANWKSSSVLVSVMNVIARYLMDNIAAEKIAFSATPKHIFQAVIDNPELFKVSNTGRSIEFVHADKIDEYVESSVLDSDIKETIKKCVCELREPLAYTFLDMGFAKEREDYLLAVPLHINWLIEMTEKHVGFNSFDYHLATTARELENFTMMVDFYRVVSKYCTANLIPCSNQANESYVVSWGEPEDLKYVELHRITDHDITYFRAIKIQAAAHAVYYGNIAFRVQDKQFEYKQNELTKIKHMIAEAKSCGVPYKNIKGIVDDIYDIYPDLYES